MMRFFYGSGSPYSWRVQLVLEEKELPYEPVLLSFQKGEHKTAEHLARHPHGKVPAISDDGVVVFESPAIALYLTDRFPQKRLGPLAGEADRGAYLSWLAYYTGVLEPSLMSKFMSVEVPRGTAGWVALEEALPAVIGRLSRGPYLLGERFSAADVLYGTTFAMFAQAPIMPKSAIIEEYVKRIVARPAYARAMAKEAA